MNLPLLEASFWVLLRKRESICLPLKSSTSRQQDVLPECPENAVYAKSGPFTEEAAVAGPDALQEPVRPSKAEYLQSSLEALAAQVDEPVAVPEQAKTQAPALLPGPARI